MIGSVMAHSTAADRAYYIIHAAIIIITTALGGTALWSGVFAAGSAMAKLPPFE